MNHKNLRTLALGAAIAGSLAAVPAAQANPFSLAALSSAYAVAGEGTCGGNKEAEGKCGGKKAEGEMKCGEGKCGADKAKTEGKCGEGKCGADMKEGEKKEGEQAKEPGQA